MTSPSIKRRFKTVYWFNIRTEEEKWGIDTRTNQSGSKWMHCCEGKVPLFFATREEAQAKIRELHKH